MTSDEQESIRRNWARDQARADAAEAERDASNTHIDKLEAEIEKAWKDLAAARTRIPEEIMIQLTRRDEQIARYDMLCQSMERDLAAARERIAALEAERDDFRQGNEKLRKVLAEFDDLLAASRTRVAALEAERDTLGATCPTCPCGFQRTRSWAGTG